MTRYAFRSTKMVRNVRCSLRSRLPMPNGVQARGLARLPVEWCKVAIILATCVVPVDSKSVQVTACRLRQSEAGVGRMDGVVEIQRLALLDWAGNTLDGLVEHARDGHRATHIILLEVDRLGFHTEHLSDQGTEGCHGATSLTAANLDQRLLLLWSGALIANEAHSNVAIGHAGPWSVSNDSEVKTIQCRVAVSPLIDMEHEREVAIASGLLAR